MNGEARNPQDPYAVGLRKDDTTVGHVPRAISCVCTLFLRRGGFIKATVTGPRRYSQDLPQGGLELPCTYRFTGEREKRKNVGYLVHPRNFNCENPDSALTRENYIPQKIPGIW